jgi:hypothetical protein
MSHTTTCVKLLPGGTGNRLADELVIVPQQVIDPSYRTAHDADVLIDTVGKNAPVTVDNKIEST